MMIVTKPSTDEYRDSWERVFGGSMADTVKNRAEDKIKGRIERIEAEIAEPTATPIKRVVTPEVSPAYGKDWASDAARRIDALASKPTVTYNVKKQYDKDRQEFYWTDGKREWDHDPNTRR